MGRLVSGSEVFGAGCNLPLRCWTPARANAQEKPSGRQSCRRQQHTHAGDLFLASTHGSKRVMKRLSELVALAPGESWGPAAGGMLWKRGASPAPLVQLVTVPFHFFFPPSRPSPQQRREQPYCSPHLCLSHPSLWLACLLACLNPVPGNKMSREATKQVQISRCAPCLLRGLVPCLQHVLSQCFCGCAFDCSENHTEGPST